MSLVGFKDIGISLRTIGIKWRKEMREFVKELREEGYNEKHICIAMFENKEKLIKANEAGNFWNVFMQVISHCPSSHNNIDPREYWELWQARERSRRDLRLTGFATLSDTPKHTECVYFIQSENGGPIKIGYSNDLVIRIRSLQNYYKQKFKVLAVIPGTYKTEKEIHRKFERYRIKGEWFKDVPRVLEKIDELKEIS